MKSVLACVALIASSTAIELEYEMGDAPILDDRAQEFDPRRMSNYDKIVGRGDTEEGPNTMKNVLVYEDAQDPDDQFRPMCNVGGILDEVDEEGPSDECCRVYEQTGYRGRRYDFCLYGVDEQPDEYEKYWQADTYGWHNEISSFKCGRKVGIRLCVHPADASTTSDKAALGECRGGRDNVIESYERMSTLDGMIADKADSVWVMKEPRHFAVIYEEPECRGPSWTAFPNARQRYIGGIQYETYGTGNSVFEGSWDFYDGNKKFIIEGVKQLKAGSSESVRLTPGLEMELFFSTNNTPGDEFHSTMFERQRSYVLRNMSDRMPCLEYPRSYYMPTGRGGAVGVTQVHSIKLRQMYLPPYAEGSSGM